jgi:hypothetical protein
MLSSKQAGDLSILFDVGGVAGGVLAGHLSDKTGANALVGGAWWPFEGVASPSPCPCGAPAGRPAGRSSCLRP